MRHILVAPVIALSVIGVWHAAKAQAIPPNLRQGTPYSQARGMILKAGWQAALFKKTILEHLDLVLQAWYLDQGFNEIEECAPTGSGLCVAQFHNADGRVLFVFTESGDRSQGAYRGAGPRIRSFCVNKRSVNCD